jgi:hypothetical protein
MKVSDEDIGALVNYAAFEMPRSGQEATLLAMRDELLALRKVADAAKRVFEVVPRWSGWEQITSLEHALKAAGR